MRRIQSHKLSCLHHQLLGNGHKLPCLNCQPHGFIRMVHHLIERCILFRMGRDECMRTLAKHANIHPIVTFTVWDGLLKENKVFFQTYARSIIPNDILNGQPEESTDVNCNGRRWASWQR